jgi:hypothetical protein
MAEIAQAPTDASPGDRSRGGYFRWEKFTGAPATAKKIANAPYKPVKPCKPGRVPSVPSVGNLTFGSHQLGSAELVRIVSYVPRVAIGGRRSEPMRSPPASRMVKNKAVYVALGVSRDGQREVRGRRGDRVKMLYWDGQGVCLYYILDRIVHNAYRLELEGQSMRKTQMKNVDESATN